MKTEKVVLFFTATLVGLLVSGAIFYIYQATKIIPQPQAKPIVVISSSPTPSSLFFLTLDSPKDEDVVNKKIITVSGKTMPDATIVILTGNSQELIAPSLNGSFSTTQTLEDGGNVVEITAIAPNGEEKKLIRTITLSSEEF